MYYLAHINSYFITNRLHGELVIKLDGKINKQLVFIPVGSKKDLNSNEIFGLFNSSLIYNRSFSLLTRYLWPLKIYQIWCDFNSVLKTNGDPDIIHAHSLIVNGLIAYLYCLKTSTPYIVTVRNTDVNFFLKSSFIFRMLGEVILKKASGIVFLSPAYRDLHARRYMSESLIKMISPKAFIIPNGINDFWLQNPEKEPKKIEGSEIKVLFAGKISRNKNLKGLLEACELLRKENINISLTVAGDGPMKNRLIQGSASFPIRYLGFISDRRQLLDVFRSSNILVVPSFNESFGLVYVEAMSQALPVIYSRGQGLDVFFPDGHIGYAVDPWNVHDIADKIKLILSNYNSLSSNALKEALAFSWDNITDKLMNQYEKALKLS